MVYQAVDDNGTKTGFVNSTVWRRFTERYGRHWTVAIDRRNGIPALVSGGGISWSDPNETPSLDSMDRRARDFLATHYDLMKTDPGQLILNPHVSSHLGEYGQFWNLVYEYEHEGVPVLGAQVIFRINHGRLIQFGAEKVGPVRVSAIPTLGRDAAYGIALRVLGVLPTDPLTTLDSGALYILPIAADPGSLRPGDWPRHYDGPSEEGYAHRLIYQFVFQLGDDERTFVIRVDAHSGAVIDIFDDTQYAQVSGGIYRRSVSDEKEVVLPFPYATVFNGRSKISDRGGYYSYESGSASVALDGAYFNVSDRCANPNLTVNGAPGHLELGTHRGTDCAVNEYSNTTKAARNAFYHLNVIRQLAMKYLQGHPQARNWFNAPLRVNVNGAITTCNASYNGAVNFYRSSYHCNNTGEISDVMQHEWGHGLDRYTKSSGMIGDSAKAEGIADINALLSTHDPCIGPGFFKEERGETATCPTAVRDVSLRVTQDNVGGFCRRTSLCTGALGYECHCESHILSGAFYNLSQRLVERHGVNEGWRRAERLFYMALPNLTQYRPATTGNAYDAVLAAADDNGDLNDGVPDGDLIYMAFNEAGIAGGPVPNHTDACIRPPAAPFPDLKREGDQITLAWPAVPGADRYDVVRRMAGTGSQAFLPLAQGLTGTSYVDTEVSRSLDYEYIVVAWDGTCASPYGSHATTASSVKFGGDRSTVRTSPRFR